MSDGDLLLRVDPERVGASGVKIVLERCFDPTHRSVSSDSKWDECQWKAKVLEDGTVKGSYGEKAAVGSVVHAAIAADLLGEAVSVPVLVDRHLEADGVTALRQVRVALRLRQCPWRSHQGPLGLARL